MSDASDDSERASQRDGQESDHSENADASDTAESQSESNSDSENDSEADGRGAHHLLDLEALESGDNESGSESTSASGDDDHDDDDDDNKPYLGLNRLPKSDGAHAHGGPFPQFSRLPIELRHRIWELFCPDLTSKAHVYEFIVAEPSARSSGPNQPIVQICAGALLSQQTAASRAVLAACRESREFALKTFPDVLQFQEGQGSLRFDKENDVVVLFSTLHDGDPETYHEPGQARWQIPGFTDQIHNLCLETTEFLIDRTPLLQANVLNACPNLKAIFCSVDPEGMTAKRLQWCASKRVNHYYLNTFEDNEYDDGHTRLEYMYCWPDLERNLEFAKAHVPDLTRLMPGLPELLRPLIEHPHIPTLWPLVKFSFEDGIHRFSRLVEMEGSMEDWEFSDASDEESGSGEEADEYESDGIDDSEIEEVVELSDDDDLVVIDDDDHSEQEGSGDDSDDDGGASTFAGFSPIHPQSETIDLTSDDIPAARFSSPELDSDSSTAREGNGSDVVGSPPSAPRNTLKRSRSRVLDSDEENEESEDEGPRKRARHRNNLIVLSDDDDSEEERKIRANSRARAVITDDEDDEDDDGPGQGIGNAHAGGAKTAESESSGSSSSKEEDESEDEDQDAEDAAARSMSLAERLQMHRHKHPIPEEEETDSEMEEMGSDDYDARNYADFQDDEEGNGDEDGEDESEDERDGLVMDMAEDGDESEDGEDGEE
ncbi:hypothetical protein B0T22DRAFT_460946 [Podospora appendiculata]|uniref:2EXR domain-containing protein n=1 Tax=Podospora appendiculata TaxID=314037 RepID=A0AAE0XAK1_9PEZI|nr:hypothetical protein B0T22DRAFT_460946 [Podospora appendiculata]